RAGWSDVARGVARRCLRAGRGGAGRRGRLRREHRSGIGSLTQTSRRLRYADHVMPPDPDTLARTLAFERDLVASVSTRLIPFAWGVAYLNDGYRERWDSNFLWVDGTAERADAAGLAAEADRILGEARLSHREIRIDDDAYGRAVAADLARAGYGGDRLVVMEQRRAPDRPSAAEGAEEIDLATLRPALEIVLQ